MTTCPKCGHALDSSDGGFIGPAVVRGIMQRFGGPEKIGANLVEALTSGEVEPGSQRHAQLHNTIRGWVSDADKVREFQQQRDDIGEKEREALAMEFVLRKVASDEEYAGRLRRALENRNLMQRLLPDPAVIEGEFTRT